MKAYKFVHNGRTYVKLGDDLILLASVDAVRKLSIEEIEEVIDETIFTSFQEEHPEFFPEPIDTELN